MIKSAVLMFIAVVLSSSNIFASSGNVVTEEEFATLCDFYEAALDLKNNETINESPSDEIASIRDAELAQTVMDKLPILFDNMFVHIISADPSSRYRLISEYKMVVTGSAWQCESAQDYYRD